MPLLNFVPPDHPVLRTRSEEVRVEEITSSEIQELIDEMLVIASGQRSGPLDRVLVGLAAPQVGVAKRVILVDIGIDPKTESLGKLQAYINPVINWCSKRTALEDEGCFSTDDLRGFVPRSIKVRISAYDRSGQMVQEEHTGYIARIFQHEIDHLDGIRFPDRLGAEGRLLWVKDEEYEEYHADWENWPKVCPFHDWMKMSGG